MKLTIGQCDIWRDGDAVTLVDTGARGSGPVIVLAHALDAPIIRGDQLGPQPNCTADERVLHARVASGLPPAPPARIDRELQGGDVLDVGGGAQVIFTPGHTHGSIALYLPALRVLFTGDTMAHFAGQVMLGPFNLDRAQAMTSLRMLAELDVASAATTFTSTTGRADSAAAAAGLAEHLGVLLSDIGTAVEHDAGEVSATRETLFAVDQALSDIFGSLW